MHNKKRLLNKIKKMKINKMNSIINNSCYQVLKLHQVNKFSRNLLNKLLLIQNVFNSWINL